MGRKSNLLLMGCGGADVAAGITDPTDIANLYAWWDATQGVDAGGSDVLSWTSQDSNGWVANSFVADPDVLSAELNGLNVIDFSGELLSFPSAFCNGFGSNSITTFTVFRPTATDPAGQVWCVGQSNGFNVRLVFNTTTANFGYNSSSPSTLVTSPGTFAAGNWYLASTYRDGSTIGISVDQEGFTTSSDGADVATSSMTGAFGSAGGGSGTMHVAIAEMIIYTAKLTDPQIADVEQYLIDKWGL